MNNLHIAEANYGDVECLHVIDKLTNPCPWSKSVMQASIEQSQYHVQVLRLADKIIGFAVVSVVFDEAQLQALAIVPSYQGEGLGEALLNSVVQLCAILQVIRLYLEVRLSNKAAITLYEKAGFIRIGQRKNYYPAQQIGGKRESAEIYTLAIT